MQFLTLPILFFLFFICSKTLAQSSPPAQAPTTATAPPAKAPAPAKPRTRSPPPPAPTDTLPILLKAGHFTTFVRLMKAANMDTQLYSQLNSSTDGITVFAPGDAAFAKLKAGALDSLNDREKLSFMQFHILPRFLSLSDFQTLSNPVRTLAGSDDRFPLSITTTDNAVTITSGLTKTSVTNTVYTDKQVAIYEIDKVLIPKNLFPPSAPAAAPMKAEEAPVFVPDDDADSSGLISCVVNYNLVFIAAILCL